MGKDQAPAPRTGETQEAQRGSSVGRFTPRSTQNVMLARRRQHRVGVRQGLKDVVQLEVTCLDCSLVERRMQTAEVVVQEA